MPFRFSEQMQLLTESVSSEIPELILRDLILFPNDDKKKDSVISNVCMIRFITYLKLMRTA